MADISIVNANELPVLDEPEMGQSIIMVDRTTNSGMVIDYNKLAETIINKLFSETPSEDSLKLFVIE